MPIQEGNQYKYEIVGDLERTNLLDTVFIRSFLTPGSENWKSYYQKHPDLEEEGKTFAYLRAKAEEEHITPLVDEMMLHAMRFAITAVATNEYVDGNPAPEKVPMDPERASIKLKGFARLMGAEMVGIGPLNPAWVYKTGIDFARFDLTETPVTLSHPHAISVGVPYPQEHIECAPRFVVALSTYAIYHRLSAITVSLAAYIRSLGYNARAHNFNFQIMQVPVAIDGGMGELGRNGIMVTEKYGCSMKPMAVTTDMPLLNDPPADFGLDEFCRECTICADVCPSGAISKGEKRVVRGIRKWPLNASTCMKYWLKTGGNCSMCIAYCPFTERRFSENQKEVLNKDISHLKEKRRESPEWVEKDKEPAIWREYLRPGHPFTNKA